MPVSKAALGRSYDADHASSSSSYLGMLSPEKRHERTISLSTIILVAVAVMFGINAITQFER